MFDKYGACWAAGKDLVVNGVQYTYKFMHSIFTDACFKVGHLRNLLRKKEEKKYTTVQMLNHAPPPNHDKFILNGAVLRWLRQLVNQVNRIVATRFLCYKSIASIPRSRGVREGSEGGSRGGLDGV